MHLRINKVIMPTVTILFLILSVIFVNCSLFENEKSGDGIGVNADRIAGHWRKVCRCGNRSFLLGGRGRGCAGSCFARAVVRLYGKL